MNRANRIDLALLVAGWSFVAMAPLVLALALANFVGCSHLGPPLPPDPTQPTFPIPSGPCAGSIDPHCWPFKAHAPDAGIDR